MNKLPAIIVAATLVSGSVSAFAADTAKTEGMKKEQHSAMKQKNKTHAVKKHAAAKQMKTDSGMKK